MSENPYQAPMVNTRTPPAGSERGIWSDGKLLVVHKQATLPPFCVKTNQPAKKEISRTFYWHPGVVYLLILLHLFIYIVAALVVRKNHKLTVPLSAEAAAKRSSRILLGWVLALLGIGVVVFGFFIILSGQSNSPYIPIGVALIVAGFVTLIVGAVLGSRAANILAAKKITEHATWFKGADPAYVRRFPPMPPFPSH